MIYSADMAQSAPPSAPVDGRRARRERSRTAVIDAVFSLLRDGNIPPTVEDVAERAGVSVSSIFRNFDGLDDLQRQVFDVFRERYSDLFAPAVEPDAPRARRIEAHVRIRLELFEAAWPMMHVARQRALDSQPIADGVARNRSELSVQTRHHFAAEAQQLTPTGAASLIGVIDTLTSPEGYEVMRTAHGRSHRQIGRAWRTAIDALLAAWPDLTTPPHTQERTS